MRRNNDVPRALNFLKTALSLAKLKGSAKKQSQTLCDLAQAHFSLGDYHAAQVDAYESQRLAKLCGNLYHEARAMHLEVNCWAVLGNYGRAISLSHRATYLLGLCGITESPLYDGALNAQAEIHKAKSEYLEAHNIHTEILHRLSDKQTSYRHGLVLLNICMVDFLLGAPTDDVQRMLNKAKSVSTAIKYVALLDWCDIIQADIDLRDGNLSVAYKEYQRSLQSAWGMDNEKVTHCLEKLSDGQRWRSTGYMSTWTTVFLVHAIKTKQKLAIHNALQFLGHLFLDLNDQTTATNLFTVALEGFTYMDVHRGRAECMLHLGELSSAQGDLSKALEHWETARPLFERSSQPKQIAVIDERITTVTLQISETHE
jgi:tetratricopeptide (TPR) repeat protein